VLHLVLTLLPRVGFCRLSLVRLRMEVGSSGIMFLDLLEVLLLGELMLLVGSSARMECKFHSFAVGWIGLDWMMGRFGVGG